MLGSPLLSPAEGDGKFWWNLLADEMAETSAPLVRISQRRWRISERKSEKIKNKSIIFRLRQTGPTAFHWQWQKQSISSSADKWRLAQAQRDFSGEDLVAVQLWKVTQRVLGRRHLWLGTLSYGSKSCFCQQRSRRPSIMRPHSSRGFHDKSGGDLRRQITTGATNHLGTWKVTRCTLAQPLTWVFKLRFSFPVAMYEASGPPPSTEQTATESERQLFGFWKMFCFENHLHPPAALST